LTSISTVPEPGFGALETSLGPLPLKAMEVKTHILGLATRVQVRQTFVNAHAEPLEAVYIFPLPPRAAVCGFTMRVGDREVKGTLFERQQARERYAQALRQGKRAALAEEDRPNVFTLSVGNLMPGDVAEVTFELAGLLTLEGEEAEWRFPLVVAPRYIPGAPLDAARAGLGTTADTDQVPDASRLNPPVLLPGFQSPVRLGIEVDWDPAGLPVSGIRASLHVVTESTAGGVTWIRLAQAERLDRDFILRCSLGAGTLQATAVRVRDSEGDASTVMVTLLPPSGTSRTERDVVFLLDRSGSMEGWKIVAARRAVSRMVDTLGPRDRFEVITFDSELEAAHGALVPATDRNRFQALEFLARAEARGGTETAPALRRALDLLKPAPDREAIVFLVTDGQVGNEDGLLRLAAGPVRFQVLGIDEAVNDGLLKRLADATRGWFLAAESEDRLDAVLVKAARAFGSPVATGLEVPGLDKLASSGSLDLYPGTPLILLGRCAGSPETVAVAGLTLPVATRSGSAVRQTWARWRVRDLEDRLVRGPEGARAELVELSLAHGVLCRFTAFLAVDGEGVVNPGGRLDTVLQPVETPRGWAGAVSACVRPSMSRNASRAIDDDDVAPSLVSFDADTEDEEPPSFACRAMQGPRVPGDSQLDDVGEARVAAKELVAFLEGLEAGEPVVFPRALVDLLLLLRYRAFRLSKAAPGLRKLLAAADKAQAPVAGLLEALQAFLAELGPEPRAFWNP